MKLLLSDKELGKGYEPCSATADCPYRLEDADCPLCINRQVAQAQLNHIFNLDAKTTTEVIVKLEAHLDKLFLKEMAK